MISLYLFGLSLLTTAVVHGCEAVSRLESRTTQPSRDGSFMAGGWYAAWHVKDLPLKAVSWSKYDVVTYAFALTTPNPNVVLLADSDRTLLPEFVQTAHQHDVKAVLSLGGWTGSRFFSANIGSAANRTAFVTSVKTLIDDYHLDGVEFDWEYPGKQGIGCNVVNRDDTANYLSFLQQLRQVVGSSKIICAAVDIKPFPDASGHPSADIPKFADVLDHIAIMNYDIPSTPSGGAGPHTPLDDSCAPLGNREGSAKSAVTAWTAAGMPRDKIVLAIAGYGHSFRVRESVAFASGSNSSLTSFPPYDINDKPKGDRWNGNGGINVCGIFEPPGGTYAFRNLVDSGYLYANGSAKVGITYRYDECSETPYIYDRKSETLIAYDDSTSSAAKGNFIRESGLKGFTMWELAGDINDILLDAIVNGTLNGSAPPDSSRQPPTSSTTAKAAATPSSFASPLYSFPVKGWTLILVLYWLVIPTIS